MNLLVGSTPACLPCIWRPHGAIRKKLLQWFDELRSGQLNESQTLLVPFCQAMAENIRKTETENLSHKLKVPSRAADAEDVNMIHVEQQPRPVRCVNLANDNHLSIVSLPCTC